MLISAISIILLSLNTRIYSLFIMKIIILKELQQTCIRKQFIFQIIREFYIFCVKEKLKSKKREWVFWKESLISKLKSIELRKIKVKALIT